MRPWTLSKWFFIFSLLQLPLDSLKPLSLLISPEMTVSVTFGSTIQQKAASSGAPEGSAQALPVSNHKQTSVPPVLSSTMGMDKDVLYHQDILKAASATSFPTSEPASCWRSSRSRLLSYTAHAPEQWGEEIGQGIWQTPQNLPSLITVMVNLPF